MTVTTGFFGVITKDENVITKTWPLDQYLTILDNIEVWVKAVLPVPYGLGWVFSEQGDYTTYDPFQIGISILFHDSGVHPLWIPKARVMEFVNAFRERLLTAESDGLGLVYKKVRKKTFQWFVASMDTVTGVFDLTHG